MEWIMEMIGQYGYGAIFVLLALGIVGLPVPDEIMMTFVGYLASINVLDYTLAVTVSFLGTMTGMTISFFVGRKFGRPLLARYGKWVFLTPNKLDKVERWFNRYGLWTIIIGYYIPGLRHLTCYFSGMIGMNFKKYILVASIGALVWCLIFITIGYVIGFNT